MAVYKTNFDGNPFIGLYARASDELTLIPKSSPDKFATRAQEVLGGRIFRASVASSPYLGVYFAINSNGIVSSPFMHKEELAEIKKLGLNVLVINEGGFSAVGNNICCNDNGAIVNEEMPPEIVKQIADVLGVEAVRMPLAGYKTVGMMAAATNKGWIAHNRINEKEAAALESIFKVKGMNATLNAGTAMVGLAVVANSKAALVGETTTGFETGRAEQALELTD
ncbi:MAG: translation initiation factor IF-6 [Candidatus Micrarchaeia archaeon]